MEWRGSHTTTTNERLREIVHEIDGDMVSASKATRDQWTELVGLLALGPSPLRSACPFCGQMVMQEATRCGYCWKALPLFVDARTPASSRG